MFWLGLWLALAIDPALRGTWEGDVAGFPFTIVIGDGTCTIGDEPARCRAAGGRLVFSGDEGEDSYGYVLRGGALTLTGDDLPGPLVLHKRGASSPPPPALAPSVDVPGAAALPVEKAAPMRGASSTFAQKGWGATLFVPGGWKAGEKNGLVLMGSDTEAGLIVVRWFPAATREQMVDVYNAGLHENGIDAQPAVEPAPFSAKGGKGLAGELAGTAQDGAQLRIRTIGVLTPYGGALSVAGITTVDKYPTLKARADAVAQGSTFQKPPKNAGIAGNYEFIYVSQSGSYSRTASLTLCASGRFSKSGEMAGSGEAGSAVTANGNGGSWSAVGDAQSGTLTLTFDGGGAASVPYQVSANPADRSAYGAAVRFGDDLYQKTGAGGC